jgi:cytochrome P450
VVVARARVPITPPSWLPTPGNRKLQGAVKRLDAAVEAMIAARSAPWTQAGPPDMLDLLLAARDENGFPMTPAEVRDQVVTFIVAGHETVASALTWAWALLAEHPRAMARLQEESDAVLSARDVTYADYARLPFARAVLDETMRLYPPAWLITRKSLQADHLAGHDVPAGALIILSPWLMHRHPDVWPSPESFTPERFLDGSADRTAFLPFGAGPRMCIGRDFAYVEAVLMLAWLAGHYGMRNPQHSGLPQGDPQVTIRPRGGVRLIPTSR